MIKITSAMRLLKFSQIIKSSSTKGIAKIQKQINVTNNESENY